MKPSPIDLELESARQAAAEGDAGRVAAWLAATELEAGKVRAVLGAVSSELGAEVLAKLPPARAAEVLLIAPPEQAAAYLGETSAAAAAGVLKELPSDERTDLLAGMEEGARAAVVEMLPGAMKAEAARLLRYAADTAGGLMETEVLAKPADATVREVIVDLRTNQPRYASMSVQYLYIVDDGRRLVGVAPVRDVLFAPEDARIGTLVRPGPVRVLDTASAQELADLFDTHPYQGLPVVDGGGVLLGVVSRADATEAEQHLTEEQYRRSQGIVGGEELRSMPVGRRVRRRGTWLGVNLVLCLAGAGVIAAFQETLAKAIVVAAVLPVISATSGNAAMQAAAVSVRELTLGVLEPGAWRRVLGQELGLALLLAAPLGLAVAGLATLWGAGWMIGAAAGAAMALNAAIAVVIGALCPLVLRRVRIDPALASGPVTTTLADVSGFALTLAFVTWTA